MDRNKRVIIFLTACALFVIACIGLAIYITYEVNQSLMKIATKIRDTDEDRLLGKKKIEGTGNLYVKFYQTDEFDMATPLDYEVVNDKDSIVFSKTFLVGTHDKEENANFLYAKVYDSILYVSYIKPNKVWKVKDLKSGKSRENLFDILRSHDSTLIEM